jgi:hypothetical protein
MLIVTSYMMYDAFSTITLYSSNLTFMVNEDEGGLGAGGVAAGILGSLGIGGEQTYNLDKILELARSNRIISESLLEKTEIDGKMDYYANHLINYFQMPQKDWKKDTMLNKGFQFTRSDLRIFNRKELSALKSLHMKLVGGNRNGGILTTSYSKASSIMQMNLVSPNEELSIKLLINIFDKLGKFYVTKTIEKQKYTYEVIINKADSIKNLLNGREYSKANFEDSNRGLISEVSKIPTHRLGRDVGMLSIMYNEAIKNAEVADFTIKSRVPFVQLIDEPFPPLKPIKPSKITNLLMGLIIGIIIGSMLIILRKIYNDALKK